MTVDWNAYDETFLRGLDVHSLIPQQEPFVMVGTLTGISETGAVTETPVQPGNLFVDGGHFSAAGIMENMAQTHAVRMGFINKFILKKDMQTGFIGAIRSAEIQALPETGETIRTEVLIREEVFGMALSDIVVTGRDGRKIATAEMKIALKEN